MFFGREDVLRSIKHEFSAQRKNISIVLYGERRTGKTSILLQIANGRLGKEFVPVYIDVQEMVMANDREFFTKITSKIMESLAKFNAITPKPNKYSEINEIIEMYETKSNPYSVFSDFLDKVSGLLNEKYLVIMFDEYELLAMKIKSNQLSPDFIRYMRHLVQGRERLAFIFTGSKRDLTYAEKEWALMLSGAIAKYISFLAVEDALDLMKKPVGGKIQYNNKAIHKLFRLTARHPYLLQLFLQNLVDYINRAREYCVTVEEINYVLNYFLDNPPPHLFYVWSDSTSKERVILSALAEIIESDDQYVSMERTEEMLMKNGAVIDKKTIREAFITLVKKGVLNCKKGQVAYNFKTDLLRYWTAREYPLFSTIEEELERIEIPTKYEIERILAERFKEFMSSK